MKSFVILLSFLICFSLANSLKYNIKDNVILKKRSRFDMEDIETCQLAIDSHCIMDSYISESNVDETCMIQNSDECKQLYDKGIDSIGECEQLPSDLRNLVEKLFIFKWNVNKIVCLKDEEGQYCPYSKAQFVNSGIKTDEEFKKVIQQNCNSAQCSTSTIDAIKDLKEAENEFEKANKELAENYKLQTIKHKKGKTEVYDEILEILNSKSCNVQYSKSSAFSVLLSNNIVKSHVFLWIFSCLLVLLL